MAERSDISKLDQEDPLSSIRDLFHVPDGLVYLDGNSLGVLPRAVPARVQEVITREWGNSLIRGWNDHDWIGLARHVGDRIGRLIGAPSGCVVAADSTSLNVVKCLSAALQLRPGRRVILSDTGNFPTDLYMAQGLIRALDQGHELRLVEPTEIESALDEDVAVMMLTEVDYRTGRLHNMEQLTALAHQAGAVVLWDLAHSAGALPVNLSTARCDFAVGCGYKYLNGGPGAPAFLYVSPTHQEKVEPFLSGWMGHAEPFAFDLNYRPADGIDRMTVGTPPILGLSALDAALDVWDGVDIEQVRAKSTALSELFIAQTKGCCTAHGIELISPCNLADRGSQVSFRCPDGYAIIQALIKNGVIGDFRAPDIMRFGFTPLYLRYCDVANAAQTLERILDQALWKAPEFQVKAKVT